MLQQKAEDIIIRKPVTNHSFENVKTKILLILEEYPLSYLEYEELIKELEKISNNTPIVF